MSHLNDETNKETKNVEETSKQTKNVESREKMEREPNDISSSSTPVQHSLYFYFCTAAVYTSFCKLTLYFYFFWIFAPAQSILVFASWLCILICLKNPLGILSMLHYVHCETDLYLPMWTMTRKQSMIKIFDFQIVVIYIRNKCELRVKTF